MQIDTFSLILGHFIADFLFQTSEMANQKWRKTWSGFHWCNLHVLIYTLIICISVNRFEAVFAIGIFIPHWIIDRYSLAEKWMHMIKRSYLLKSESPLYLSLGVSLYIFIDQTLHFLCLKILINLY